MTRQKSIQTPLEDQFYAYRGTVMRVIDGDTLELGIDFGFGIYTVQTFRLYGIDAPEKRTAAGKKTLEYLEFLFPVENEPRIYIRTIKNRGKVASKEKFGRFLVEIYACVDDLNAGFASSVNQKLIDEGLAKPYFGHGNGGKTRK